MRGNEPARHRLYKLVKGQKDQRHSWGVPHRVRRSRLLRLPRVGRDLQAGFIDGLEVAAEDFAEHVQCGEVPARIGCAADEPGAAVVGQDHPIFFECG